MPTKRKKKNVTKCGKERKKKERVELLRLRVRAYVSKYYVIQHAKKKDGDDDDDNESVSCLLSPLLNSTL